MTVLVGRRPLSLERAYRHLGDASSGGVVLFVGRVRPEDQRGRPLVALDYEADVRMAVGALRRLEGECARRFGTRKVFVEHRIGRLRVGTASVIVGAAAPHRAAAFQAARFLIECLKLEAPIWKTDRYRSNRRTVAR
ncbi:MAG: molybdenum cofactor biosynthesis protein MoaE [Thermoplasmata archaeon]|nr:molybdenum cofactor biosynthesis protein MoaE [Thermoplasmata archaeon]